MTVSIEQLRDFTKKIGLSHKDLDLSTGAALAVEVPVEGGNGRKFTLLVRSYDNGEMFEATAANFIPTELCQQSEHKGAFLFYLLNKAWETKFGTPEIDKDGEVRVLVEIPLADAEMTPKQYGRILKTLTQLAVKIGMEGQQILDKGSIEDSQPNNKDQKSREIMIAMIDMVGTASGRAQLLKIVADEDYPDEIRSTAASILKAAAASPDSL